jgi:23S rRNA pseudouridine1911/1915/1917 synthase
MPPIERVLLLHRDYLVLNKVPGESVEPLAAPGSGMVDLPRSLGKDLGGGFLPAAPHRLDVPVSGCVLFARNPGTLAFLSRCFRSPGLVEKTYWAVVEPGAPELLAPPGSPPFPWVELVHWLEPGRGNRILAYDGEGPGRKKAVLRCRLLGRGERYLFLELRLVTGRRHQIRAQLSRAGLPVKGDLKYGARRSEKAGGIRLHCRSLAFPDPEDRDGDRMIRVEAPPPCPDGLWGAFMEAACRPACPPARP